VACSSLKNVICRSIATAQLLRFYIWRRVDNMRWTHNNKTLWYDEYQIIISLSWTHFVEPNTRTSSNTINTLCDNASTLYVRRGVIRTQSLPWFRLNLRVFLNVSLSYYNVARCKNRKVFSDRMRARAAVERTTTVLFRITMISTTRLLYDSTRIISWR